MEIRNFFNRFIDNSEIELSHSAIKKDAFTI